MNQIDEKMRLRFDNEEMTRRLIENIEKNMESKLDSLQSERVVNLEELVCLQQEEQEKINKKLENLEQQTRLMNQSHSSSKDFSRLDISIKELNEKLNLYDEKLKADSGLKEMSL
eukprot:TRINITY_DN11355_c0_g1_i1.p1 TRINITY_DN11355_c0_g1~~TRINITY_DN11355_c0_g1_i1.p1  ORF type:complete len:115 (-),score=38.54 TRINITY_DN11355_c0_g1_i1:283-627(-)